LQIPVMAILLAFAVALLITPQVIKWAFKWGALDRPDNRKVHQKVMPRLGGLAVFIAFTAAVLLTQELTHNVIGLLVGGGLIVVLGLFDDTRGLSPKVKLAGQVVAACAVIAFGVRVDFLTNPFGEEYLLLGLLSIPVTVLWIVSVTNAVNLIDGLDGLAGGTVGIAGLTLAAVVFIETTQSGGLTGQYEAITLALILVAAVLGFLRYNFFPAKIFLGDTGSMFLGFSIAVLAVMGVAKSATFISVIIPVVILGLPLLDTTCAIIRRFIWQMPIMQPDKEHLHHRLMEMGLNHRQAVLCIYCVNIVLGLSAILLTLITQEQAVIFLVVLSTAILILANKIGVTGSRTRKSYPTQTKEQQRSSYL
jgi:UDP-GlcNAc:undecaprenyl-phosphate GlcNAc-1-phosphate transferase